MAKKKKPLPPGIPEWERPEWEENERQVEEAEKRIATEKPKAPKRK